MKIKNINIKILLETSSGQGSEMCIKLEDLSKFITDPNSSVTGPEVL